MKIYKYLLFIAVTIFILLFFGCSRVNIDEEYEDEGEFPIPEIKDIEIWGAWTTFTQETIDELIEEFELDYPEFTLSIAMDKASPENLTAAIAAETMPDLIVWDEIIYCYFHRFIQPMDPYMAMDPSFDREDYLEMVYLFNDIKDETWALSMSASTVVLMYNKDMFEAYGLDPENPPERWSEMIEIQKALTKRNSRGLVEQTGFADFDLDGLGQGYIWFVANLYDGTNYLDTEGCYKMRINTESVYEAAELYRTLHGIYGGKKKLAPEIETLLPQAAFTAGRLGMRLTDNLSSMIGHDFNVGITPFPNSDHIAPDMYVNALPQFSYMIVRNCPNPMGAWYYLKWHNLRGLLINENCNYNKDPTTYVPRFMTNTYARTRIADIYYDYLDGETRKSIEKRDAMIMNMNLIYNPWPANGRQRFFLFGSVTDIFTKPNQNQDIRARLADTQRTADDWVNEWLAEREKEGWLFPEDNPWGIPPEFV